MPPPPTTCGNMPDGAQVLYIASDLTRPWTARCVDGETYLPLAHTGIDENYSQYKAGGYSPGTDVVTRYAAVRFDPVSMLVDVSDQTFTTSSGSLQGPGGTITSMPYGVAMDCVSKLGTTAAASVDLRDTPFAIRNNVFSAGGFQMASGASISSDAKLALLRGGGECGWVSAGPYSGAPVNKAGGFQLPLQYSP